MNTIELKKQKLSRQKLLDISEETAPLIKAIEDDIFQKISERFCRTNGLEKSDVSEKQLPFIHEYFDKCVKYAVIDYPINSFIMLTNETNGGFEYSYDLELLEDYLIRAKIIQKTTINKNPNYLIQKEKEDTISYAFYLEYVYDDTDETFEIILIKFP